LLTHQQSVYDADTSATGGEPVRAEGTATVPETIANTDTGTTTPAIRRRDRALVVLGTIVAAVAVWAVSVVLLGVDLQAVQDGATQTIGVAVAAAAAVPSLLGWALLAGLERFSRRPKTIWTIVAVLVTVLSLAGPFSGAATTGSAVSLALMHLVVGAVAILGFRRTTR
jgi:peptidoglycan/LPS O-acetylase OafA/YrhL